ncbi:uncharacterized protein LOC122944138 [Bufo gargarizans]|uniref:uncharacterized protein LOC122944138 n=1 Tax=Bufo gargarizans TaxID=30331 RepID=UPI001CF44B7A|nr:uncharacterized protein LOC122944138 [Bufo gargarizans]
MEIDYSTLKRSTLKDLLEARGISASNKTKATLISEIMAEIRTEDDSVTAQRDETDGTEQAEFQRHLLFRLSFYGENPPVEIISKTMTEVQEFITRQRRPQTPSPAVSMVQEDASMFGLGAVLSQVGADGGEHPVAYISRKLLPREVSYATIEKECLAVVWALKKLQPKGERTQPPRRRQTLSCRYQVEKERDGFLRIKEQLISRHNYVLT